MYSKELLKPADLQPFINQPETLINQTLEFQLRVANYSQTPIELLKILVNQSCYLQVVEAAKLHINLAGEIEGDWGEIAEYKIKNAPLQQNDRLVAELLKIAPVPEYLISEWIPGYILIQGLENPYLAKADKIKLLERLGKSTIIEERLTAASHPDTPRETLEILAGDLELPIRIAVKYRDDSFDDLIEVIESQHEIASNWETLALELIELGRSKWSWVRQTVARNFYAPSEVLRELAGDGEEKIQLAIARNLATPAGVLDLLVNHGWGEVTESIAKHPNASENSLVKLLSQHKRLITERPNLPAGVLAELLNYGEEEYSYEGFVVQRLNTSGATLAKITDTLENDLRLVYSSQNLAKHPNILMTSLQKLSEHKNPIVRLAVCENPKIPDYLRNQILEESINLPKQKEFQYTKNYKITSELIWASLAKFETTPGFILERLSSRIDLLNNVRKYAVIAINILGNSNTPKSLRDKLQEKLQLSEDFQGQYPDWDIRIALAFNSSVPENKREEYFQQVINDNSRSCEYLAKNPKTPLHIIEKIYQMGFNHGILINPNTPISILRQFAQSNYKGIRHEVAKNPSITSDILVELINSENPQYRPRKRSGFPYRSYEDWSKFWFEYSNISALDLYRLLLSKELATESKNAKDFICGLIGKTFDDDWISITPTVPTRHTLLPEEIAAYDYQFSINQNLGENILNLESNVKQILEELNPLKLAICYPAGYSYSYIYQHCSAISQIKESAITQSFLKSGLFKIYKFQDFLSETDSSHYYESLRRKREQILSRFFKATFTETKIYHLALYDIDYTYILGETPDKDYVGIKISRYYQYNP